MIFSNNPKIPRKKIFTATALLIFLLLLLLSAFSVISFIDLAVSSTSITFSNNNPIEGELVNISAMISNLGNETATNATLQYLDDKKEISNVTINVPNFSSVAASLFWPAEIGPNNISIIIDPDNSIAESDETNNYASKKIAINGYHTYFGKAAGYLALGINSKFLFQAKLPACNILMADTDSNVDFSSLQAIGKKKNAGNSNRDFEEIDTLLGMATFSDSVTNLFSVKHGGKMVPKQVETFTIFGTTIPDVPVINSTNSSAFLTGILWDISDDTVGKNGEFDIINREDLIFVTKINPSQQGQYGVYDYEIKIPALLREYKPGNPTVDFFIDIDSCLS
ncbi:MAG: CARDB domain-containing protein [Nanoarchaeota archaeon]